MVFDALRSVILHMHCCGRAPHRDFLVHVSLCLRGGCECERETERQRNVWWECCASFSPD